MTIAMMSWGAEKTLKNTLESYARFGLLDLPDERLILLQDGNRYQENLSLAYGFTPITLSKNVGIATGYSLLVNSASEEFFLFLENDWELIETPDIQIAEAKTMIKHAYIDIVRFRHRKNPGNPLWTRQFEGREYDRPSHLLDSIHWLEKPPGIEISTIDMQPEAGHWDRWWYTHAEYANWTNNPHMAFTSFLKENVLPRMGNRDLEIDIQGWWQQQDFKVAQGDGLFTHNRLD